MAKVEGTPMGGCKEGLSIRTVNKVVIKCGLQLTNSVPSYIGNCGSTDYDMYSVRRHSNNCTGLFKAGGKDANYSWYILMEDTYIYSIWHGVVIDWLWTPSRSPELLPAPLTEETPAGDICFITTWLCYRVCIYTCKYIVSHAVSYTHLTLPTIYSV